MVGIFPSVSVQSVTMGLVLGKQADTAETLLAQMCPYEHLCEWRQGKLWASEVGLDFVPLAPQQAPSPAHSHAWRPGHIPALWGPIRTQTPRLATNCDKRLKTNILGEAQ